MPSPRRSKSRKQAEAEGYRSAFERAVALQLIEDGARFEYEPKDKILPYEVNEHRKYLPDFVLRNGVVVECKGRLTAADRKKLLLVRDQHPDVDLRLVFMYDNKLNPKSKTRYSAWAEKNGIKYAMKRVPKEWTE